MVGRVEECSVAVTCHEILQIDPLALLWRQQLTLSQSLFNLLMCVQSSSSNKLQKNCSLDDYSSVIVRNITVYVLHVVLRLQLLRQL